MLIRALKITIPILALALCRPMLQMCDVMAQTGANNRPSPFVEARALLDAGRYDEVIKKLSGVASSADENTEISYLLGISWYQKRDYQRAVELLRPVVRQERETTREYQESVLALGLSHYLLGHLAESVPLLEKAAAWSPSNNELAYALGMASIQTRQPDKARESFARMFRVPVDSPAAHLLTAQMMVRVEFEEFAEVELKKALEKDPKLPQANYLLGQIAIYKGRFDEGIALMERELAINPGNANAHYKIGDAYTRLLKWDEAIVALQKSVWLYPFYSGPYILLGKSYLKKRQLSNAEGMLKRAIQFDPNNKSAHYLLGQVYQQSNRPEDAKREFAIAEKLQGSPDQPEK
jgi:tetratricopeptide (TPR) repeat protein